MALSLELISQFAKLSAGNKETSKESTAYATIYQVHADGNVDICIDGSVTSNEETQEQISPAICTSEVKEGDRVTVLIKNHSAIVTGNINSPSASIDNVSGISNKTDAVESNIIDILGSDLSGSTEGFIFDINGRVTNLDADLSGVSGGLDYLTEEVNTASKTATNYIGLSSIGLVVGDMTTNSLGKNVLIGSDKVAIRNGDDVLASFNENSISFDKHVTFTSDDGLLMNNGDAYAYVGRNDILWSGAYYMNADQSINFKTNLSRQLMGAVFVWSYYDGTNAQDQNFVYFFVPKTHVINHSGSGVSMDNPYLGLMKYLYISNSGATGNINNASEGTTNGISWNNRNYVLRYVIGV